MNSRRYSFILASLCYLLLIPAQGAEPRNLKEALLNYPWEWTHAPKPPDVLIFGKDGIARCPRFTWHWKITGPNTAIAFNATQGDMKLPKFQAEITFDASLSTLTAKTPEGKNHYVGRRLSAVSPSGPGTGLQTSPPPAALTLDPNQPLLDTFTQLAPNASAWVLAGLDEGVPPNVRQNLTYIREDLLDEYKQKPKASQDAYKLAHQLCTTMINALDERDQTLVRAGFRAVQADASISGTNQALEVRRNYMMSWPQYAREQAQRAELIRQGTAGAQVGKALPKVEWSTRTAKLRKTLDDLYAQFREALRQSAAGK
jgi:hypothetical protein